MPTLNFKISLHFKIYLESSHVIALRKDEVFNTMGLVVTDVFILVTSLYNYCYIIVVSLNIIPNTV